MKKTFLYTLWAGLSLLCIGLSFIPQPSRALQGIMTLLSILFFVPGFLLLWDARRRKDEKTIKLLRLMSILSLCLTLALFIFNIWAVLGSELLGNVLYVLLLVVSVPMVCSGHYALSLFLWVCLLICVLPQTLKPNQK